MNTLRQRGYIEETKLDDRAVQLLVQRVKYLTKHNAHTESIQAAAEVLGAKKIAEIAKLIKKLGDLEHGMPESLIKYRNEVLGGLLEFAKHKMSAEDHKALKAAF